MNKDLYNHGTLGVASDGRCQPWKLLGRLEGWDPLLTTEAKIYGLFFCSFSETLQTLPGTTEQW